MSDTLLKSLDTFLCLFIITPLSLLWWSGTWHLMRIYCAKLHLMESLDHDLNSALVSLVVGSLLCVGGNIVLPVFIKRLVDHNDKKSVIIVRMYVYTYSLGYLNFWRGVWNISNIVTSHGSHIYLISYITFGFAYVILILLKTTNNTIGVPFSVSVDKISHFSQMTLCFETQWSREEVGAFLADVVVTVFLVQTLAIEVWWSLWSVCSQWIHFQWSSIWTNTTCLLIGYALTLVLTFSSILLKLLARKLHNVQRWLSYAFVVCVKLVATLSGLLIWKGGWQMLDNYVVSGSEWRSWVCHFTGFLGLLLLQVCSLLAPFGCAVDNVDDIEFSYCFPTVYFNRIPVCITNVQTEDYPNPGRNSRDLTENRPPINTA